MIPKLAAWAHAINTEAELDALLESWQGSLGVVLYPHQYEWAGEIPLRIAYVPNLTAAARASNAHAAGHPFSFAIVEDEGNLHNRDPREYAVAFRDAQRDLESVGISTSTMGVGVKHRSWLADALQMGRYDNAYAESLPTASLRAWNPNGVRLSTVTRTLATPGAAWILSPAMRRPVPSTILAWIAQHAIGMSVKRWIELSRHPSVKVVAIWCLRSYASQPIWGLHRANGTLTAPGRALHQLITR